MHSHVMYIVHACFCRSDTVFSPVEASQVSKDSRDAKGGGEMRTGLGRIIKQVACQGWGTSSRST